MWPAPQTPPTTSFGSSNRFPPKVYNSFDSSDFNNGAIEDSHSRFSARQRREASSSHEQRSRETAHRMIEVIKNAGDGDMAEVLQGWRAPLSSRNIVEVLTSLNHLQTALRFFSWSSSRPDVCETTVFCYNAMLRLLRDHGDQRGISRQLLEEMLARRVMPDNYTFSLFLACCKQCGRVEEAIEWFNRLTKAGLVFDKVVYSSMLDIYGDAGQTQEAMELYRELKSKSNWKLDMVAFGVLANVHARVGDYQAILGLFRDMEEMNIKPNVVLFNTLLGALGKAGRIKLAREVFGQMLVRYGVSPSSVSLCILIDMHTKAGESEKAVEIYHMIKHRSWSCDVSVYNSLLKSCVESGEAERAELLIREMNETGCFPDHMTYGILMNIYSNKGMVKKVCETYHKLNHLVEFPAVNFYTMMIKACKQAGDLDRIPEVVREMLTSGCFLNNDRLSVLLMSCATSSSHVKRETRLEILDCLARVNPRLHRTLFGVIESRGNVLEEMDEFLMKTTTTAYRKPLCNAMIDFCCFAGRKDLAQKLLEVGVSGGLYKGLETSLPTLWQLNLRTLSFSSAECALEMWIQKVAEAGEALPEELMIETGVGRAKEGMKNVSLSDAVSDMLRRMNSPFRENAWPVGYFIATGETVAKWLRTRKLEN